MRISSLFRGIAVAALLPWFVLGCGGDDGVRPDTRSPAAVTDLCAAPASTSSVVLAWTATGDDGQSGTASKYDIRYSSLSGTGSAWWEVAGAVPDPPAPAPAGQPESLVVSDLDSEVVYYFALKVADEVPIWSEMSNVTRCTPDPIPPAPVIDLSGVSINPWSITMSWTASGDDGDEGTARQYDIRYSTSPNGVQEWWESAIPVANAPQPKPAGAEEVLELGANEPGVTYYFALKVADDVPNWSELSNVASVTTLSCLDTPSTILDCLAWSYNQRDYDFFHPLIHDGFVFVFTKEDVDTNPEVPPEGVWGKTEELEVHSNLLDPNFIPEDPALKIDGIQLEVQLSGDLAPSNYQGAPAGTLEGYVTIDLQVETEGGTTYLIQGRPLFFFAPNTGVTPPSWTIWRICDSPFDEGSIAAARVAGTSAERISWGALKVMYR